MYQVDSGAYWQAQLMFWGPKIAIAILITRLLKDSKLKVQAQIQGDKVRVIGKKRDDLQEAIAFLRKADIGMPLQFNNFRD